MLFLANVSGYSVRFRGKYLFTIKPSSVVLVTVLTLLVLFTALPLVYLVVTAFKPIDELYLFPPTFFTRRPTVDNFKTLLNSLGNSEVPFIRYIFNSIFTTVATVFLTVFVCSLAAFGLVKQKPRGADLIFALFLMALMFPGTVTQIPNYLIIKKLGFLNNYLSLIVPKVAVAFNFFLVKQFMEQIPDSLIEAARIDGASQWKTFWRIVMPNVRGAWLTLLMLSVQTLWGTGANNYIYKDELKTLNYALGQIMSGGVARAGVGAAVTLFMMIVPIAIFIFSQNNIVETMSSSGMKD